MQLSCVAVAHCNYGKNYGKKDKGIDIRQGVYTPGLDAEAKGMTELKDRQSKGRRIYVNGKIVIRRGQ